MIWRKRPPYITAENGLGIYCVPRKALHRPACKAIMGGKIWERDTLKFLCDNANGDIVHGGTFFGDFLPALSRAYEEVWAFEPNTDNFKCAELTIRLNDITNVSLRNSGMGAALGMATLTTQQAGVYLGGASFITDKPGETVIEAIDAVVPSDRKIGMIQLDVEGYEEPALQGAMETIRRWRPIIVVETVPPSIHELGYRKVAKIDANHVFRSC